jgi:hypothetical protein
MRHETVVQAGYRTSRPSPTCEGKIFWLGPNVGTANAFQRQERDVAVATRFPKFVLDPQRLSTALRSAGYGFKLPAWSTLNGKVAQDLIWLANEHDLVAGYQLNKKWVEYGAPQQIGDKAYLDGTDVTSPRSNRPPAKVSR